ncbi:hypothetical protein [Glutamicibacter sp. BW77]|uniref:hypothetical protein n=1 Tax=Glutamicibacter sp. BW77 TaxID=2024402 RepID=UPI000BB6FC35|nr:hypothetical protein [Glutamicibacter sp. BW77]PCC37219.1 hypothetical protein CIK74_01785 [Glutamicibacter sp. BW77]
MEGFIDHISPDRKVLKGWIKNPDELEPTLKVRMGEEVFGYGQISAPSDGTLKLKGEDARSFTIYTDRKIGPSEILEGSLSVVSVPNQYGKPVYPSGGLIKREERYFSEYFARLPETLKSAIKDQLDVNVALAPKKPESENELSYMHFPVGLEDSKRTVRLGKEGYLFAVGGANKIESRYKEPQSPAEIAAMNKEISSWKRLINSRFNYCSSKGIKFLQFIVPDKITALPQFSPIDFKGATPMYRKLIEEMASEKHYLDLLPIFENWSSELSPWRKADGHPSARTMYEISTSVISALGLDTGILDAMKFDKTRYQEGDLGQRFFNIPIWDESIEPKSMPNVNIREIVEVRKRNQFNEFATVNPRIGVYLQFENPNPLIRKKVMLFGTSTASYGMLPNQLTWWLKQIFSEFHFVWQTDLEYDLIEQNQPDIVICQTVERFLARTPSK